MMSFITIEQTLIEVIIRSGVAIGLTWGLYRTSLLWFGFSAKKELKAGNKAVAFFWMGLLIMIGIIVALVKV